jgi:cardiolipin synthase
MSSFLLGLLGFSATAAEILGVITAVHAVMGARTSQGAIAWALSLVMFPYISLPLYWVLGRNKFHGYTVARRGGDSQIRRVIQEAGQRAQEDGLLRHTEVHDLRLFERLAKMPFTHQNDVRLLIDGDATFEAIFEGLKNARDYVLVQFFIVHDDQLGRELKRRLIERAQAGVRIYFLYDEAGSRGLPRAYIRELTAAGVQIRPFCTTKGFRNRFQINFRNHRKIVVVDGRVAFVGGLNVGDEYLGRNPKIGPWRDTHVRIEGPAVHAVQLSFFEDWYWATLEAPAFDWNPRPAAGGQQDVLVLPTGPADELETCSLFFVQAIHLARHRLWIASPYFVPDPQVMCALQIAAMRGVDVRIVQPDNPDHLLVYLSGFSFLDEAEKAGVKIYRYEPGFLHHKVILIDDDLAAVGTANLDNRSFRLNFEITILVDDHQFAESVRQMFERDFAHCRLAKPEDLAGRSFWFKVAVRVARLMAPLQ